MNNISDSAQLKPFQCFMGHWEGLCMTFDAGGNFLESAAVHLRADWLSDTVWRFQETWDNLYGFGKAEFDINLTVEGKTCFGADEKVSITGIGITPENYVFTIESKISQAIVYNNHYFLNSQQRRVITHKLREGKTHIFQIQDFGRVE
ncbi:hypothetical protein [Lyngbya sp. CCY1209]|uniref:hypothetical protein n=1 Tax=Lyngbya sp. CCY1209 TaxID=2886103 RepID=UPI002D203D62|nr:hypothetical protein [Lyngbya sp. CCY1209]MEB3882110.1 hypothetical protein [Lyngbya sp. CCY1209]